jgi:hypothetical protein
MGLREKQCEEYILTKERMDAESLLHKLENKYGRQIQCFKNLQIQIADCDLKAKLIVQDIEIVKRYIDRITREEVSKGLGIE